MLGGSDAFNHLVEGEIERMSGRAGDHGIGESGQLAEGGLAQEVDTSGVRPNSDTHITSVVSSSPRLLRSFKRAEIGRASCRERVCYAG